MRNVTIPNKLINSCPPVVSKKGVDVVVLDVGVPPGELPRLVGDPVGTSVDTGNVNINVGEVVGEFVTSQ